MKRRRYSIQIANNYERLYEWEEHKRHDKVRRLWLLCLKDTVLTNQVQLDNTTVRNLLRPIDQELEILKEDIETETNMIEFYKNRLEYRAPLG